MFAVISYKGNQYKVEENKEYQIDLLENNEGKITFSEVLLIDDGKDIKIGTPIIEGASVDAEIIGITRGNKVTGIKFRPKKHYQRNLGHKEDYTLVKISSIKS